MHERVRNADADVAEALARGEPIDAHAVLLLLRAYQRHQDEDAADRLGRALAMGLDECRRAPTVIARAAWLACFVDAAFVSDDDRIRAAIGALAGDLRSAWDAPRVDEAAAAIGACLDAVRLDEFKSIAADAVDALERVVGRTYRPGSGVGAFADQVRTASTLLAAFYLTGRLPYSMLAEELMQLAGRCASDDFAVACEAARVYCRLAALHGDADYRAAAVLAPGADYLSDAERLLMRQSAEAQRRGAGGAIYGVALLELESARSALPGT